jgi:extracellular elastinolytic metalloproteinase
MRRILVLALAGLALLPATAFGAGNIPEIHDEPLGDVDTRTGTVQPTAAQRAAVAALDASATWTRFGAPATLINHEGWLATGVGGATAADAARAFLDANKALFRLSSVGSLELEVTRKLGSGDGYAVVFRQHFDELAAIEDGYASVSVAGSPGNWKIGFVGGSLVAGGAVAQPTLSAGSAWLAAANAIGEGRSFANLTAAKTQGEWKVFGVRGMSQLQRARLRALPVAGGIRPVWETLFVEVAGGHTAGYSSLVDAVTGEVLVRHNLVHQSHESASSFNGTVPPLDAACDVDKGPYVVGPTETVASVEVAVEALPVNDAVLQLKRNGSVVASADTLTNPEAIHYGPAGGVPAGSYTVAVCDFADGHAWDQPATYVGQIAFSETGASVPYPPKWKVFPANPQLAALNEYPWNFSAADLRQTWCWDSVVAGNPVAGCDAEVQNLASRFPWDVEPRSQLPTFTTIGNNAQAAEAWVNPPTVQFGNISPGPTNYRPVSPQRNYTSPWENAWFAASCNPAALVPGVGADIGAAVTNLFVMHNRMHDWSYHLGLTEETWNAQMTNFGTGGTLDGDPVIGDVQSGAVSGGAPAYGGRDNANMLTLPDGVPPITNMYLWQPLRGAFYAPCVDGDYDMAIIGHEYGHMIENRLIGKGGNRSGHHTGAMGESHGDLMAMEYLNEYDFAGKGGENRYAVGAYATGQKERGIRNYAMDDSPLNFSDMGYDITGPQVHADGEIWSATQFDVRRGLVAKYGEGDPALQKLCADGKKDASECPGNRRWIQLVFDAYLLMPIDASMVEARDAMLAADRARFGGANQAEIWLAFARRGLGTGATSTNTSADTPNDPTPDFGSPLAQNATVTFAPVAADEGNAAVAKARLYVGHYEGRVSPVADTDSSTSGENLDATFSIAPGSYDLVVAAPGYGHTRLTRTFAAGETVSLAPALSTNWASGSKGAVATGDGLRVGELIDDTEATNWEASGGAVDGRHVTVDLSGGAHTIERVNVSALLKAGQNRFTALRQFELWTCLQSDSVGCADPANYVKQFTSAEDAFPAGAPRPVAPELLLRTFTLPAPLRATHVRFVVLDTQCTGQAAFHGSQDSDPTNPTDCRTGREAEQSALLPPRDTTVVAAELQVFGAGGTSGGGGSTTGGGGSTTGGGGSTTGGGGSTTGGGGTTTGGGSSGGSTGGGGGGGGGGGAPAPPTAGQPAPSAPVTEPATGGVAGAATTQKRSVRGTGAIRQGSFQVDLSKGQLGKVGFRDLQSQLRLRNVKLATVRYSGKTATLTGTGIWQGKRVGYVVTVTDRGAGRLDSFTIRLANGYTRSGRLVRGDLVVR